MRAKYPYDDYNLYIVYHKNEQRRYACLVPINNLNGLKRTTISLARYLMSCKEGRILSKTEHVDHIDNNRLNDNIDNLQILSPRENNIKEARRHGRKMIVLRCPTCGKVFEKPFSKTAVCNKVGKYSYCSRHCSGVHGENFENIIRIYQKH